MDTYDIVFGRIQGVKYVIMRELKGIYNDQLRDIFEKYTGLYTRL